jgi:N-acetylglucosamine malate deacetylase 2
MRPVVGVFAHPDDEVFGPGGTLALFAKEGRDTYIICVTDGDAGQNSSNDHRRLGEIRREELQKSAKELGVKEVFFLGYKDGTLSNNLYHEVAKKITDILDRLDPEILLTMEHRGVSGHLDHIAVSMISSYVYEHKKSIKEIWYYALTEEARKLQSPYFIYFPPGYKASEINKTVTIGSVWDQKVRAMHQHLSQTHDINRIIGQFMKRPKEEYFFIVNRSTKDME